MDRFSHLKTTVEEHRPDAGQDQVKLLSDSIAINTRADFLELLNHATYYRLGLDEGCGVMCMETDKPGIKDLTAIYFKEGADLEPARVVWEEIIAAREAAKPDIPPATCPPGYEPLPKKQKTGDNDNATEKEESEEGVQRRAEGVKVNLQKKLKTMAEHMAELEKQMQEVDGVNEDLEEENEAHENQESELERNNLRLKRRITRLEALVSKVQATSDIFGQKYVDMRDDMLL